VKNLKLQTSNFTLSHLLLPKILHLVENLHRGAVENWLVRMLRHARAKGIELDWTFYCALGQAGDLDEEVRQLGVRIVYSPVPIGQKTAFIKALRQHLQSERYEVLHAHHDLISGLYLLSALGLPIRKRLVHVHNADESVLTDHPIKQRLFRPLLRQLCLRLADGIVGISQHTLDTFLAGRPRRPGRDGVHYYGIDATPFLNSVDRAGFRQNLGLPSSAKLLLFAGRLVPEKNPLFALEVLREMRRRDAAVRGVFVGSGSLEQPLQQQAAAEGLSEATRFLGWRHDIPAVMKACDWFILPRPEQPMEGLGIAVIEAQLAGLRLLLSCGIPDDALLPGSVAQRIPLSEPASHWADIALNQPHPTAQLAIDALANSPFDRDRALEQLMELH
jgi:glycosyltransferase involved in cell wall biosynthesis